MHARTFLCREALWQTFEEIAREQGAPIDDVLSDAMRSYARQRSYGSEAQGASSPNAGYGPPNAGYGPPDADPYDSDAADLARTGALRPTTQRPQAPNDPGMRRSSMSGPGRSGVGVPPPPGPMSARGASQQRPYTPGQMPAPPPQRARPMAGAPPPMRSAMSHVPSRSVPPPPRSVPPPLPPSEPVVGAVYGSPRTRTAQLTLTYDGRHSDVSSERFVLGRSKTQADLVLEDPNVSRQHAAIERVGNDWVLVDLGSTNGCYIGGQRVSRRNIADGDVIEITTHQIHCTLR